MKVYIGPFPRCLDCTIHKNYMNKKYGYFEWDKNNNGWESFLELVEIVVDKFYNLLNKLYFGNRTQKVKVKIDYWDTWSADYTLSLIIVPLLKKILDNNVGVPFIDIEDTPKELHPNEEELILLNKDMKCDSKFEDRWKWILSEMVWAFEQIKEDPVIINREQEIEHTRRLKNGLRLFGKYFQCLWD